MTAYYNEIDPYAAQWLCNLIDAGHIASGVVDTRSIEDIHPSDLTGFTQCHFFAGIGVWSLALRRAGWPDDRPVWTGSCPCQPFSSAGQGAGFADERHLWPAFFHLISQRKPSAVFGEQVASKDADPWIDLVQDDLEGLGYAFGAVAFPSASVGAPHIRDRTYWMANANGCAGSEGRAHFRGRASGGHAKSWARPSRSSVLDGVGDAYSERAGWIGRAVRVTFSGHDRKLVPNDACASGFSGRLADAFSRQHIPGSPWTDQRGFPARDGGCEEHSQPGPTNGLWTAADWLLCRDGKWRPVEPSTFPLAHGAAARVGRLRAYGNAINAEAARVFIESAMTEAA